MTIKIFFLILLCFSGTVFSAVSNNSDLRVVGGYNNIGTADPGATEAANFAVEKINKGTLVRIVSVKSKVANGINYSLQLEIDEGEAGNHIYNAVVLIPQATSGDVSPMRLISSEEVFQFGQ